MSAPFLIRPAEPGDVDVLHRFVLDGDARCVGEEGQSEYYPSYSTIVGRTGTGCPSRLEWWVLSSARGPRLR